MRDKQIWVKRVWIIMGLASVVPLVGWAQGEGGRSVSTPDAQRALSLLRGTQADLQEAQELAQRIEDEALCNRLNRILRRAKNDVADARHEVHLLGRAFQRPMAPDAFVEAMKRAKAETFDDGLLAFVRSLSTHNRFASQQARELLATFHFDLQRGEAAVALYPQVTDPGNFFVALDTFRFDSERQKVRERLRQRDLVEAEE